MDRGLGSTSETFERSMTQQVLGGGCALFGGLSFLSVALLAVLGVLGPGLELRLMFGGGFGFFGLLMTAGAVSAMRRGDDPRVAEISAAGAWLPEMGFLRWPDIAEVRLERIRGVGSAEAPVTREFRRLGFVPRDPSLRAAASTSLAWRLSSLYFRMLRAIAPELRMGGDDPAPFGVSGSDIPHDFDRLLESVGRHATIVDAAEVRARERAPRWASQPQPSTGGPHLATLDAALAGPRATSVAGAAGATSAASAASTASRLVAALPGPARPAASFGVPAIKPLEAVVAIVPVVAPLAIVIPAILPTLLAGGAGATGSFAILGFVVLAFVLPGAVGVARLIRRALERRANGTRLRVGPDGIWTPASGLLPWPAVRTIRTERAGWARQIGRPSVERWRIAVEPALAGAPAGTALSDELDTRFDDILDLIRVYHPVSESS